MELPTVLCTRGSIRRILAGRRLVERHVRAIHRRDIAMEVCVKKVIGLSLLMCVAAFAQQNMGGGEQ